MSEIQPYEKGKGGMIEGPGFAKMEQGYAPLRTITTCPGIGDTIWLMQKLVHAGERFHFKIPDGEPRRGHQIFDLLPNIAASCTYTPNLKYKTINDKNITNSKKKWHQVTDKEFYLSANLWLEGGSKIASWLPDLQTSYKLEYATTDADKERAGGLMPDKYKYIGIYTSAYSNARHWNAWGVSEWMELIRNLNKRGAVFVMVGASYDIGITEDIMGLMRLENIAFVNTVGEPLSVVVELLKRMVYFIGFPSGLSILNETLGKDGCMMYSKGGIGVDGNRTPDHTKLMNAWVDPERVKSGAYKGCIFPEPDKLYLWLRDVYKIFSKL